MDGSVIHALVSFPYYELNDQKVTLYLILLTFLGGQDYRLLQ